MTEKWLSIDVCGLDPAKRGQVEEQIRWLLLDEIAAGFFFIVDDIAKKIWRANGGQSCAISLQWFEERESVCLGAKEHREAVLDMLVASESVRLLTAAPGLGVGRPCADPIEPDGR